MSIYDFIATTLDTPNTLFNCSKTEQGYEIEVMLPGVEKESIKVEYESSILKISCERKVEKKDYICLYFDNRTYTTSIELKGIDFENSEGEYKNGILYLKLPKTNINSKLNIK